MATALSTILVVEPDDVQRSIIVRCLQPRYRIVEARRLDEAMAQIDQLHPAIVVLEPDLPDGDGLAWLRQLRTNAATSSVIVVCATKRSSIRDKIAGFKAGADDYVVFPVDRDTFLDRVTLLTRVVRLTRQ